MAEITDIFTSIPRGTHASEGPCWIAVARNGKRCRPVVKCKCGRICVISLHHVQEDGTVTASFFDSKENTFVHQGKTYGHMPGCDWHVWLKLVAYDQGEFLPQPLEDDLQRHRENV